MIATIEKLSKLEKDYHGSFYIRIGGDELIVFLDTGEHVLKPDATLSLLENDVLEKAVFDLNLISKIYEILIENKK